MKSVRYVCWLLVVASALAGCASPKSAWISDEQRSESFKAYRASKIEDQSINLFLKQRAAVLVSGFPVSASKSTNQVLSLEFKPKENQVLWVGHAAAIDTNGYFLTAAHCVDHANNYLVYFDGQSAKIAIPRIVAKIWNPSKNLDIAIIHIDAKLHDVFALAATEEFHPRQPAIAVGNYQIQRLSANLTNWSLVRDVCFAGRITSVTAAHDGTLFVCGDLPGREGDSGGPLVTTNGTLMGIHSGVWVDWLGKARTVAILPSSSWLANIIEQDRLRLDREPQLDPSITLVPLTSRDKDKVGMVVLLNYDEQSLSRKQ